MQSYKPSRIGKAHIILPLGLIFCGIAAVCGSSMQHTFAPMILQVVGAAALVGAIWVINRYSVPTFLYTVDEETPDLLCVYRIVGKKKVTAATADLKLARVKYVEGGAAAVPAVEGGRPEPEIDEGKKINLCLNMFPAATAHITLAAADGNRTLIIECDAGFFAELERRTK